MNSFILDWSMFKGSLVMGLKAIRGPKLRTILGLLGSMVGLLFGVDPAWKASALVPIEALRYDVVTWILRSHRQSQRRDL